MPRFEAVETLPDEPLVLSLKGRDGTVRDYEIQPVDAETWYKFSALGQVFEAASAGQKPNAADAEVADQLADELGALGLQRASLGADNVSAMLADGVSAPDFRRAYTTALVWHTSGGDTDRAMSVWTAGKAPTPSPDPTPETESSTSPDSTSTAAVSATRRPASGTGTSSRPKRKSKTGRA